MTDIQDENLKRIDAALGDLPPEDAPEALVQDTLKQVRDSENTGRPSSRFRVIDMNWANGIAATIVAAAALGIVYQQVDFLQTPEPESSISSTHQNARNKLLEREISLDEIRVTAEVVEGGLADRTIGDELAELPGEKKREFYRSDQPNVIGAVGSIDTVGGRMEIPAAAPVFEQSAARNQRTLERDKGLQDERQRSYREMDDGVLDYSDRYSELKSDDDSNVESGAFQARLAPDTQPAERFLARYQSLEGLDYQQPAGYWTNSYVPGHPAMRRLEAQLRAQHPEALNATLERNAQPFDAPVNAALSAYLHATQTAVDGPSRVQLQVGLKAAERQGGLRLPMNIAVVLDLPETVDVQVAQQLRALLLAMNEQRQTGDHFSVTVAGTPGGSVVAPDEFRHGSVVSFIDELVNGQLEGERLDLVDALVMAVDQLAAVDDPDAVLGSSLVLLVSADGIEQESVDSVEILAHRSAVAGMPLSVVTLAGVNSSDLEAITLAGQGRLLAFDTPAEAGPLVDKELHAASRTVARAVRLRIQLAPGVQLVDVIGSRKLDELDAERVREAEQSIDQRLSRNWGIQADRDEDEDGIQIVIPAMAAGESHVVLLDVVVDGPGSVADVQVRYKDLVQMSNGVARASLALADADAARQVQGPLERNLLKNLLAFEISEAARRSGRALASGDALQARAELSNALVLIAGLRERIAGWSSDAELLADEQHLARFVSELDAGDTDLLVAELEYAAYRKLLPASFNQD